MIKKTMQRLSRHMPPTWARALRRRYYFRVVKQFREKDWEWATFVKPLIAPGGQVLDLGANVGYLSALFARWVGPRGQVISLEPTPATYDALQYSMKRLFPATVIPVQQCVSDAPGEVVMHIPSYADGTANYYESRIAQTPEPSGSNSFRATATTLDAILHSQSPEFNPCFIKIDVEGHEEAVIRGGSDYLSRKKPPLLIEVSGDPDQSGSQAARLFAILSGWGYTPHVIRNGALCVRQVGDRAVDYLFLAKS